MSRPFDARIARIAERQLGVFCTDQVIRLGATHAMIRSRLRAGRWVRLHTGVYAIAGVRLTFEAKVLGACLATGGVASHRTAGRLWGLPHCEDAPIEVLVPVHRRVRRPGIVVHRTKAFDRTDVTRLGPVPITSLPRTIATLAETMSPDDVEDGIDHAVVRKLTTEDRLERRAGTLAARGRPGTRTLTIVLCRRYGSPESTLERRALRVLQRAGLPPPAIQYVIRDALGRFLGRADMAYPARKLGIELVSWKHHGGRRAFERDHERTARIVAAGWRMLPFTDRSVRSRTIFLERVRTALA